MSQHIQTTAIVLTRVNYGEADRILTVITPDLGKISLIAKGARKQKSKLAGGIELFSVSEVMYVAGRGSVATLASARLVRHYANIVDDIKRTMLGYDCLKLLHSVTESHTEKEYFILLDNLFAALDKPEIDSALVRAWFGAQLLQLAGHAPNLKTTATGSTLDAGRYYQFDYDTMAFRTHDETGFGTSEVKFLRLLFSHNAPQVLARIVGAEDLSRRVSPLMQTLQQLYLH